MDPFITDWQILFRTVVVGVLAYLGLILMLRVSGKRTLSQFNAFDFIVTVALGSTLATVLVSADVPLLQGLLAFGVLIGMQFAITWTSLRSRTVARLAKSEPTVMAYRGWPLSDAMSRERLLSDELAAALREHGVSRIDEADLVVLETDGAISVIKDIDPSAVEDRRMGVSVPRPRPEDDMAR